MKENKIIYIFYGIMGLMIFVFVLFVSKVDSEQYPALNKYEKCFSGIIKEKSYGQAGSMTVLFFDKSILYIGLLYKSDTIKGDQLKMKEWDRNLLSEFLIYGDSIFKPQGSDTVFVYRKGECYTFINRHQGEKK